MTHILGGKNLPFQGPLGAPDGWASCALQFLRINWSTTCASWALGCPCCGPPYPAGACESPVQPDIGRPGGVPVSGSLWLAKLQRLLRLPTWKGKPTSTNLCGSWRLLPLINFRGAIHQPARHLLRFTAQQLASKGGSGLPGLPELRSSYGWEPVHRIT